MQRICLGSYSFVKSFVFLEKIEVDRIKLHFMLFKKKSELTTMMNL